MSELPLSSHGKPVDTFKDAPALESELRKNVGGEVRFDRGSRALYATDASNYRQVPIGLVIPRNEDDVVAAVAACRKFGAPVLPRGAGTSLAGQSCNVAVVIDFTKTMNRIIELDPAQRFARVQPGLVLDHLRGQAEKHRLTFGPDPASHNRCTLGGMIGNNSCGTHSLLAGKTVDNVEEMDILLYDGTRMRVGRTRDEELQTIMNQGGRRAAIYQGLRDIRDTYATLIRARFPRIPRRVSGYNLDELLPENGFHVARALVGTEGTCMTVLSARLKLVESPQQRSLVGLGYADTFAGADDVPKILEFNPIGLEGFEGTMADALRRKGASNLELLPPGRGLLLVELGSNDAAETEQRARRMMEAVGRGAHAPNMRLYNQSEAKALWNIREAGPRAAAFSPGAPMRWEGWDDAAVAPEKLGAYLRDLRRLLDEFDYQAAFYGHFGHGCIHMQVSFDLQSETGIRKFNDFLNRAADLVVSYGGSLSGEHGDGQARAALLPKMFGPELIDAFCKFKTLWDPDGKMNPHKVVDPYSPIENLRLGADFNPAQPPTNFKLPEDAGSLSNATLRCIGIGACRKTDAGTMCPSYRATLEEQHSPRGRAHLLFEMLQGEVLRDHWQDEHVKESLDLCLSCKACKNECPLNVDIATYKAEFLSHYYEHRRRPLRAYAFGRIDRWARLGSMAPFIPNFFAHAPLFSTWLKGILGMAAARKIPALATQNFQSWARRSMIPGLGEIPRERIQSQAASRGQVILWADTFTNYFHPGTGRAALKVLEHAGFEVKVPQDRLCCGRPLYDFGMLDHAKKYLRRVLEVLKNEIQSGAAVIVLEPSCASVFRDEMCNLFPGDALAEQLRRQTFLLSEFLEQRAPDYQPPRLERRVVLHGHCHQKALMKMGHAEALLRKMGADLNSLEAGCCGMAGPFGFEKDKYDVAQAIGERVLLPAVRATSEDTLIVTDGFSCREQVFQSTGRRAWHLAEVIQLALELARSGAEVKPAHPFTSAAAH
ncbi:MAG TPA: FAD-linked oxidase C-terminal domain-containing protein [Terriglobia bacterium]|nr:FAD-linked oxidase C-terminal domain-containing protein [Terriglobia bacterium]